MFARKSMRFCARVVGGREDNIVFSLFQSAYLIFMDCFVSSYLTTSKNRSDKTLYAIIY